VDACGKWEWEGCVVNALNGLVHGGEGVKVGEKGHCRSIPHSVDIYPPFDSERVGVRMPVC
jgi:hypothetical protein